MIFVPPWNKCSLPAGSSARRRCHDARSKALTMPGPPRGSPEFHGSRASTRITVIPWMRAAMKGRRAGDPGPSRWARTWARTWALLWLSRGAADRLFDPREGPEPRTRPSDRRPGRCFKEGRSQPRGQLADEKSRDVRGRRRLVDLQVAHGRRRRQRAGSVPQGSPQEARPRRVRVPPHAGAALREEVAQRANVSMTWYTLLERGRGGAPSRRRARSYRGRARVVRDRARAPAPACVRPLARGPPGGLLIHRGQGASFCDV